MTSDAPGAVLTGHRVDGDRPWPGKPPLDGAGFGDWALRMLVGDAVPTAGDVERLARPDAAGWTNLWRLSVSNVIPRRLFERLAVLGSPAPPPLIAEALRVEAMRVQRALEVIGRVTATFAGAGLPVVFTKAFQHFPDMGHDIDLFVVDRTRRSDALLMEQLGAVQDRNSLTNSVAGKRAWVVPGVPLPVEIHHGRLGHVGEHAAFAESMARNRREIVVGGIRTWVPSREDQLIVQVLQRMYSHLHLRVSDVALSIHTVREAAFDWDHVAASARRIGVLPGLVGYLECVRQIHRRSVGQELPVPEPRRLGARVWHLNARFAGSTYQLPRGRTLMRVYGAKLAADVRAGRCASVGRLALLPPLALSAAAGAVWRRVAGRRGAARR